MRTANLLIAIMGVVATLLTAWIGVRATYDINDRGSLPPKRLEARYLGPTDPLQDLRDGDGQLEISVRHAKAEVKNLRIVQATLENTGKAPILPSDFIEPLGLRTKEPWKIVAVANNSVSGVKLKWNRVSDYHYSSDPTLLNPDDSVWATVYVTADKIEKDDISSNTVEWTARIVNLKAIGKKPSIFDESQRLSALPFVNLSFPAAMFALLTFSVYFLLTFLLLERLGTLRLRKKRRYAYILGATSLNLFAAEAGATYVFGFPSIFPLPVDHVSNATPLILNILMILLLSFRTFKWDGNSERVPPGAE